MARLEFLDCDKELKFKLTHNPFSPHESNPVAFLLSENGKEVQLKKGAEVDVTIEAGSAGTTPKNEKGRKE